jgi:transposase
MPAAALRRVPLRHACRSPRAEERFRCIPKQTDGIVESIRELRVARQSAVKARSAALAQLKDLLVTAPEPLRAQLSGTRRPEARRAAAAGCGPRSGNSSAQRRALASRCAPSRGASRS